MTFLEWCQLDIEDDIHPIELSVDGRLKVEANESVPMWYVEMFKSMEVDGEPILVDGVWRVNLRRN